MTIARVFPRKTKQSPTDSLAFFDEPDLLTPYFDEAHISVSFTYDIKKAEGLARAWAYNAKVVKIGGPAFGQPSGEFVPGKYVRQGITYTSRGCPNKCWFCSVWKREPELKELEIKPGYIIQDDNLLACSEKHIRAVFKMMEGQKNRPEFTGGLEARILEDWHCELFAKLNPKSMYFAYDTKDDLEPLIYAGEKLYQYGFGWPCHNVRCLVLIGGPNDTINKAETRLFETISAGFWPQAMLWRNEKGDVDKTWQRFSREWARPPIYYDRVMRFKAN